MTTAITKITNEFEGCEITTLNYLGRPAWIAREIGEAIGYSQGGKHFAGYINGEWADEFIEGQDYVLLTGKQLSDVKAVLGEHGSRRMKSNRGLIILFESGLSIALARTYKPVSKRLRRFFADEVLPQIDRDDSSLPGNQNSSVVDLRIAREERLARQLEFKAIKELVKTLRVTGKCDENVLINHEIAAAEAATGMDLSELKRATDCWLSLSEIADKLDITTLRVELIIRRLRMLGDIDGLYPPETVEAIVDELAFDDEWCASHTVRCRYIVEPISG